MSSAVAQSQKKVLVVDDDPTVVRLIEQLLQHNGYTPVTASLYTEAVEALDRERPDLVLLDLSMPHVNGGALLEFIRQAGYDLPVIVVSGYLDGDVAEGLSQYDVSSFIWKPFNILDLTEAIVRAIGVAGDTPEAPDSEAPVVSPSLTPGMMGPGLEDEVTGEATPLPEPSSLPEVVELSEAAASPAETAPAGAVDVPSTIPAQGILPVVGSGEHSGKPERVVTDENGNRFRVRRHRHRPKRSRRRTLMYLGLVTLASIVIALGMNLAGFYAEKVQGKAVRSMDESLKEQILDELRKEQLLEELLSDKAK
jgi:CheY-like chemotaxis protein